MRQKIIVKIDEIERWLFEKINKIGKHLAILTKKKEKELKYIK